MDIKRKTQIVAVLLSFLFYSFSAFAGGVKSFFPRFDNFTQRDGLSNNVVQCAFQDRNGRMWFGTSQGLNFYDGYLFESYKHSQEDETSMRGELVRTISQDSKGVLWVGTEHGGLNRFDISLKKFSYISFPGKEKTFNYSVNCVAEDSKGVLWVASEEGLLFLNEKGLLETKEITAENFFGLGNVRKLYVDAQDNIWIASKKHGVCIYNPYTNFYKEITVPYLQDEDDSVLSIFQSRDGNVWLGTYYSGVFVVDPKRYVIRRLASFPVSERNATVRSIIEDADGLMWFGSRGGLLVYDRATDSYSQFFHDRTNPVSLVHNSIIELYLDRKGDMWLGTRGGISYLDRDKQNFRVINEANNDDHSLNNGEVYAFWEDRTANRLWIGTESGGINILDNESGRMSYITKKNGLTSNCVKCFFLNGDEVWVGTYLGGIVVLDATTGKVKRVFRNREGDNSSLISDIVWNIYRDSRGLLWIATGKGLDLYDSKRGSFSHLKHIKHDSNVYWVAEDDEHDLWIGSDDEVIVYNPDKDDIIRYAERTRSFAQTKDGSVWLGTLSYGLAKYHKHNGLIRYYSEKDGLVNNNVQSLTVDGSDDLWVATFNGLSRFNWKSASFKNYDEYDGLQDNHFHYNAACKLENGQIAIGGLNGVNIFDPMKVRNSEFEAEVLLRDFYVFNQPVGMGENLSENIASAKEVVLDYDQNMFSFTFATLSYSKSRKNKYMYKMEGFDADWIYAGNSNRATYTNLNPGTYTFMVKGSNCDGHWNENVRSLKVVILPPFWGTWWFKSLVFLLIVTAAFSLIRYYISRERRDNESHFERVKNMNQKVLRKKEENFYAELSQELRMPLTYVLGAVTEIIRQNTTNEAVAEHAQLAERNLVKAISVINRIPDFETMERGESQPSYVSCDVLGWIYCLVQPYIVAAGNQRKTVLFERNQDRMDARVDKRRMGDFVCAVLDYAVCHTKEGGSVVVNVSNELNGFYAVTISFDGDWLKNEQDVLTQDNGDGEQFSFATIKKYIEEMNGRLTVDSNRKSECTTVCAELPFLKAIAEEKTSLEVGDGDGFSLLIAENDSLFRTYLKSGFSTECTFLEADNGEMAYEQVLANLPDVVLVNWSLPQHNGEKLCHRLKLDERTRHLYVVVYSSLDVEELASEAGADDYETMPFDVCKLGRRVSNLLTTRYGLKRKFKMEMLQEPNNVKLDSPDEKLMNRIMEVVESNISDSEFGIDKFAVEVGLSRMQLYRKVDSLTKMTVKEFIRSVRIKRAVQMLEQKKMTVSEVAYEVGFKDIAYFRRCFKNQTGKNPSDVQTEG